MTLDRYVARLIGLSILPMLLLALWLGVWLIRDIEGDASTEAHEIAEQVATIVDREIESYAVTLKAVMVPAIDNDIDWQDLELQARSFHRAFGMPVLVVDEQLNPRLASGVSAQPGASLPPLSEPLRQTVQRALQTSEPVVGNLSLGPQGDATFGIAVHLGRMEFTRLAAAAPVKARSILGALEKVWMPEDWSVSVLDEQGAIVAHRGPGKSDASAAVGVNANANANAQSAVASGLDTVIERVDHRVRLTSAPWTVVVGVPSSEPRTLLAWAGMGVVLSILFATAVSAYVGRGVGRRLRRELKTLEIANPDNNAAEPKIDEVRTLHHRLLAMEADRRTVETALRTRLEHTAVELQMSQTRLRGVFDSVSDAIITTDDTQTIVMANPAAANMFRCPLPELLGTSIDRFIPEHHREHHRVQMRRFGATAKHSASMNHRPGVTGLRADGTEFPVEAAISCINVDGQRLFNVILRDISDREHAQEVLRSSKAKLDAALASMSDAVSIADTSGRLIEINDAFVMFHRYPDKESVPREAEVYSKVVDFCLADGQPTPLDMWPTARALRGETGSSVEYTLRRKDTGDNWVGSYSFAPILGEDGSITGAVATARDVTELYRVRAELVASQASLRRLLAAQDSVQETERKRIARELHDELQQILAAIRLDASSAAVELVSHPQGVPELLSKIEELATSAIVSTRRIVNDLRPQMLEDLGLVPALEALATRFNQRTRIACEVRARGRFQSDAEVPAALATCLYRVTQEALNNVTKHAEAGLVVVRLSDDGEGGIVLTVTDDGVGLDPKDRSKPDSYGLHGMDERVRALGGRVFVDSWPGAGTTVRVVLPLN
jgi:PAS domain S-box-containing protein